MITIRQRTFLYLLLSSIISLRSRYRKPEGDQALIGFNRSFRERPHHTPRRRLRAFAEALANLRPAGRNSTTIVFLLQVRHESGTCVLKRGWYCQLRGIVFLPSIFHQVSSNSEGNRLHHV